MTKHVHADLMAEYAKDAQTTNKPWEYWEFNVPEWGASAWMKLSDTPMWYIKHKYRRKRKTHIVNGKEVAAPLDSIKEGQRAYMFSSIIQGNSRYKEYGLYEPHRWTDELVRGLLFATEEDAKENFEAYFPIRNI